MTSHRSIHLAPIAAALALACTPAAALEWFPRQPGPGDTTYLLYVDACGNRGPIGTPVLRVDAESGLADLVFATDDDAICIGTPPPGAATVHAFEIPAEVDGTPVRRVTADIDAGRAGAQRIVLQRPSTLGIPPSIVGTWYAAGHVRQGFLITMTQRGELAVSWNTYDADGNKAWFSGIAQTQPGSSTATIDLLDTNGGFFGRHQQLITTPKDWGTVLLDYEGCGRMHMAWEPSAYTTLDAGEDDFTQLTAPHGDACDLPAWAAATGRALDIVELDLQVTGGAPD